MMTTAEPIKVLTVENDPIVRADLRLVLEDFGIRVCADARDGIEAIEYAREHRPDLIVMDLGLPVLDGAEATRQIRREHDVPIVVLTGHRDGDLVDRARAAGAVRHVLKPFHPAHLVDALNESLRGYRDALDAEARWKERRAELIREEHAHHMRMQATRSDDWDHAMPRSFAPWLRWWQ